MHYLFFALAILSSTAAHAATTFAITSVQVTDQIGAHSLQVTWPSTNRNRIYTLKYGTSVDNFTTTVSTSAKSPTTISGLTGGTLYYFEVIATNTKTHQTLTATASGTPLNQPTNLSVSQSGTNAPTLTWAGTTPGAKYKVAYGTTAGSYTTIASMSATSPYSISGLAPATTYYFMLTAMNASGYLDPSAPASIKTAALPTPTPSPTATPKPNPTATPGNGAPTVQRTKSLPLQGNVIHVAAFTGSAIQSAINTANAGDTVYFPAGTYSITTTLSLKPGVLYHGEAGAILYSASGATIASNAWDVIPSNLSIDGLTFNGGNLSLSGASATSLATNIVVINSTFENIKLSSDFSAEQGIILSSITNSRFDYNYFTNNGSGADPEAYAIIDYSTNNTSFSNNTLINTFQGFHFESGTRSLNGSDGNGLNLTINNNIGWGIKEIGIEINAWISNSNISGNQFSNWVNGGAQGMAYSIVSWGTNNTVQNNYADATGCTTCNIGIEVGGTNSFIENNSIIGFETGICITSSVGTLIQNNTLTGHAAGTGSGWAWGAISKDGGWAPGYTIGTNTINGVATVGYNVQ